MMPCRSLLIAYIGLVRTQSYSMRAWLWSICLQISNMLAKFSSHWPSCSFKVVHGFVTCCFPCTSLPTYSCIVLWILCAHNVSSIRLDWMRCPSHQCWWVWFCYGLPRCLLSLSFWLACLTCVGCFLCCFAGVPPVLSLAWRKKWWDHWPWRPFEMRLFVPSALRHCCLKMLAKINKIFSESWQNC